MDWIYGIISPPAQEEIVYNPVSNGHNSPVTIMDDSSSEEYEDDFEEESEEN